MYACMQFVYMYVSMYVNIYIYMYVCMYLYSGMYISIYVNIIFHREIHVCMYVRTYVRMYVCVCVCIPIKHLPSPSYVEGFLHMRQASDLREAEILVQQRIRRMPQQVLCKHPLKRSAAKDLVILAEPKH